MSEINEDNLILAEHPEIENVEALQQIVQDQPLDPAIHMQMNTPVRDRGGRPTTLSLRSRKRRSRADFTGPSKILEDDIDYVGDGKHVAPLLGRDKVNSFFRYFGTLGDDLVEKYHDYPVNSAGFDKKAHPKLQDSRLHRWIRKVQKHPYISANQIVGVDNENTSFEALMELSHSTIRGSYQRTVDNWNALELFILAYFPNSEWAVMLRKMEDLDEEVRFDKPVATEIILSFLRAYAAPTTATVVVNGLTTVQGRGAVFQTLKNKLSQLATLQTSLGHKNLSVDYFNDPSLRNVLNRGKKGFGRNTHDLERRAISYNVVVCLPWIVKGILK